MPLVAPEISAHFDTVLDWADELRRLGVRANADTPADARRAREFGAEGIGLCRTEHMFMQAERQPKMRAMIMADTEEARHAALEELLPLQRADFEGLFEAMDGRPVTIRLLDPPLHEFLPSKSELLVERERLRRSDDAERIAELGTAACPRARARRGEPDARHARLPARRPLPGGLRDAGARDRGRRAGGAGARRHARRSWRS